MLWKVPHKISAVADHPRIKKVRKMDISTAALSERLILQDEVCSFLKNYYGGKLERILQKIPLAPLETTLRVNTLKTNRTDLINQLGCYFKQESVLHAKLEKQAKVYFDKQHNDNNTPQHDHDDKTKSFLDFEIVPDNLLSDCIRIPSKGPNDVQHIYPEIVVDTKCGEAVLRGADIFAPGVLGAVSGIRGGDKVSVVVDIDGKVHRGDTNKFEGNKVFIGNGIARMGRSMFYSEKSGVAIEMTDRVYDVPSLNGVFPDLFYLQNYPSLLVAHILDPQPTDFVLDMCASPGGKTTHIATLMKNSGKIIAIDKNDAKVKLITDHCERYGISNVQTFAMDSSKLLKDPKNTDTKKVVVQFPPSTFDRILLDPPCSGLGQRPRLKDSTSLATLKSFAPYQRKLFHTAFSLLKPGGVLVYSTCTLNPQENEEMVAFALDTYPSLKLVSQEPFKAGSDALTWDPSVASSYRPLTVEESKLCQKFDMENFDAIGFFIAKFVKAT